MEAATLKTKKTVNKGKIKKTLKNILCRPDPIFWPLVSDEQKTLIETILSKHNVEIPNFEKLHWKKLKLIPKEERPKPPKIKRVEGLFFGISECINALKSDNCAAILVESTVNPRAIVQPVIDTCIDSKVAVICINGLRSICASNFGIPTSCLGIKSDSLPDLRSQITEIAKSFKPPKITKTLQDIEMKDVTKVEEPFVEIHAPTIQCPYLYRTSKKTRVFNPSEVPDKCGNVAEFSGQDFIELSGKNDSSSVEKSDRNSYVKMVLKKISNNPKRVKVK